MNNKPTDDRYYAKLVRQLKKEDPLFIEETFLYNDGYFVYERNVDSVPEIEINDNPIIIEMNTSDSLETVKNKTLKAIKNFEGGLN